MALSPNESIRFDYNGYMQSITLTPGKYYLQCYGAKGYNGSYGGYTRGYIRLKKTTTLYVSCGQSPTSYKGGWNDGGDCSNTSGYGGGGRTDISLYGTNSTSWNTSTHLNSIILAAQGGSGGTYTYQVTTGTPAGTLSSGSKSFSGTSEGYVYSHYATANYTISFYSTNCTSDPYGVVRSNGSIVASNDDGGSGLNFSLSFSAVKGRTYTFYIRGYSSNSRGTASYYITRGTVYDTETVYVYGGSGAGSNYGYRSSSVSSYPFGSCTLDSESYLESYSSVSTGSSAANGHGYAIITRVPVNITYTNCSGSASSVYGGESVTVNANDTLISSQRLFAFTMFEISTVLDSSLIRGKPITIDIPEDIWYDITVKAIFNGILRYNSNLYRDSQSINAFDFCKMLDLEVENDENSGEDIIDIDTPTGGDG